MKSIKPGRGPSAMGAAMSVVIGVFGIFWTIGAASMGAPPFFVIFGIVFVIIAIVQAAYNFSNATGKHRMSVFDITNAADEPDPLERFVSRTPPADSLSSSTHERPRQARRFQYCPYCGDALNNEQFRFCPTCGKELKS